MKKFALIGAAGYIAPRHMKAIKDTNNQLVAALDKNDSVGVIDSYFPEAHFFTEFERFDRYIDKLNRKNSGVDYISIASPNYLHDAHIRFSLRSGAQAICEKPLVLNPWNIEGLIDIEKATGCKVYNILQLRLHESVIELRRRVKLELEVNPGKIFDVDLTYITSRGNWYHASWKGESNKSGGIATNIGVHFYDMLSWVFGDVKENIVHLNEQDSAAGFLEFGCARVRWFLSVNYDSIPDEIKASGKRTYRSITIDGDELEFSEGFTELHTRSYERILEGRGFGLEEARSSIQMVHDIRESSVQRNRGELHPMVMQVKS